MERPLRDVGSGNVFRDLGLPDPDARLRRADLASRALRDLTLRFPTDQERAAHLGITVDALLRIVRGHLDDMGEDELERVARRASA